MATKVIVLGPTGAVGSSTARTAAGLGAHVTLAMRDTSKSIPGLDADQEKSGNYQRIQADLMQPDTVSEAVKASGAKHAFIYLMFMSQDAMKSSLEAAKAAGIEFVVFLSSFSIQKDIREIEPAEAIPWMHAKVEITLEEVFGADNVVSVRPGSFSTNALRYSKAIEQGHAKVFIPKTKIDCIVPEDIGAVCGTVLAKGVPQDGNKAIYLYGPQLLTTQQSVEILAKKLGKEVTVEGISKDEAREMFKEENLPPPVVEYFITQTEKGDSGDNDMFGYRMNPADADNISKYGNGKKATTFAEWADHYVSQLSA